MTTSPPTSTPSSSDVHPLDWQKRALPAFAKRTVAAAAEALLADRDPRSGDWLLPDRALLDRVVDGVDLWVGAASFELGKGFVALVVALDAIPLTLLRKPRRFVRLSVEDRIACLEKLERSRFSMLLLALKVPIVTLAFERGDLLASTGFDRPTLASRRSLLGRRA